MSSTTAPVRPAPIDQSGGSHPRLAGQPTVVIADAPSAAAKLPLPAWQLAALAALLGWAYWPMLGVFFDKWSNDPQYSHGFLVPFFSAYLLWQAWKDGPLVTRPMPVVGLGLLALTLGMRAVAGGLLFHQLDAAALLLSLLAVAVAAGGVPLLKRVAPAVLFLGFMVPLPFELERNVGQPLKDAATVSSTFLLQTLGQPAVRDGNLILIDEVRLGVVDACSGLKMLVTFAAFSVGAVLVMRRTLFEKFMVVLGIAPVAILANVIRITATGLVYAGTESEDTRRMSHDLFGYLMMVIGMALLGAEVWALRRLVVDPE